MHTEDINSRTDFRT